MNIERMRRAVALWSSIPASEWNLDRYEAVLGSRACCALGHLAARNFEGLTMDDHSYGSLGPTYGPSYNGISAGAAFFDLSYELALHLFQSCAGTSERHGLPSRFVDKNIFFNRLRSVCKYLRVDYSELFKVTDEAPGDTQQSDELQVEDQFSPIAVYTPEEEPALSTSLLRRLIARFAEPVL